MLNYEVTETTVNLSFSKEHLNSQELLRLLVILRIKELLSQSQATKNDAMALDEDLKSTW